MPSNSQSGDVHLGRLASKTGNPPQAQTKPGDQVVFGRTPSPQRSQPVASASAMIATGIAFPVLIFLLYATISASGSSSHLAPLMPEILKQKYSAFVEDPNHKERRKMMWPSYASVLSRLESLKHLEDTGFSSDARREWIELHLLTCIDTSNPVCEFASNRLRHLP